MVTEQHHVGAPSRIVDARDDSLCSKCIVVLPFPADLWWWEQAIRLTKMSVAREGRLYFQTKRVVRAMFHFDSTIPDSATRSTSFALIYQGIWILDAKS